MIKLEGRILSCLLVAAISGCGAEDPGRTRDGSARGAAGSISTGSKVDNPGLTNFAGSSSGLAPIIGGGGNGAKPPVDPNTCASASVRASRITPTVHLVLDGSSSMNAQFGGAGTRWQVLRQALVGPSGVVTKLESVVNFGMSIYSNNDPMKCPATVEVKPAVMNFMPISSAFPAMETGGGTPTGEALQRVVDSLPDYTMIGPDAKTEGPPIILLATDGEPNGCANGVVCNWVDWANCLGQLLGSLANAPVTYETTLAAVRKAQQKGIQVWVVSLADGLNNIPDLQRTANIGAGLKEDAKPGATIYSPQNPDELTGTLTKLIGDVVSCDVELKGSLVVDRACEGEVTMNGLKLDCNGAEGWKAIDDKHIQLVGSACAKFKGDPSILLDARFPCDVVVPL
ncbi:MAG TPA: vWA domain-containing protein [Polyangiales bacterium]|nr:vWA domain-containing protein [Polyangiales bacterium]